MKVPVWVSLGIAVAQGFEPSCLTGGVTGHTRHIQKIQRTQAMAGSLTVRVGSRSSKGLDSWRGREQSASAAQKLVFAKDFAHRSVPWFPFPSLINHMHPHFYQTARETVRATLPSQSIHSNYRKTHQTSPEPHNLMEEGLARQSAGSNKSVP